VIGWPDRNTENSYARIVDESRIVLAVERQRPDGGDQRVQPGVAPQRRDDADRNAFAFEDRNGFRSTANNYDFAQSVKQFRETCQRFRFFKKSLHSYACQENHNLDATLEEIVQQERNVAPAIQRDFAYSRYAVRNTAMTPNKISHLATHASL